MKERPILFSAPMVRALLAGTKTQTRRVMKPQPRGNGRLHFGELICLNDYLPPSAILWEHDSVIGYDAEKLCPYGVPGDRLWVRETWAPRSDLTLAKIQRPFFRSTDGIDDMPNPWRWRPSIHMPRWASRISLEITDVRVQRLQEISEDDAKAEGIVEHAACFHVPGDGYPNPQSTARSAFALLWESINGADSWDANPWVWTLTFKRVDQVAA